jgi:hypothetical protein
MDNLPGVFKINRVNKAMASLAERIASARNIAESIPQIKTVVLNLQDEDESQPNVPDNPTPIPPKQENDLQLGAIFPNTFVPNSSEESRVCEVIVVVVKGKVQKYFIVNKDGIEQKDWEPQVIDDINKLSAETKRKANSITQASRGKVKLKFFSIKIPSNVECNSCYYFVAQSTEKYSEHKDRLMLFVSYGNLTGA